VPQSYFDHYPLDSIQLPPFLENDLLDIPAAGIAIANWTCYKELDTELRYKSHILTFNHEKKQKEL